MVVWEIIRTTALFLILLNYWSFCVDTQIYIARIHDLRFYAKSNHCTLNVWISNNSINADFELFTDIKAPNYILEIIQPLETGDRTTVKQTIKICELSRVFKLGPVQFGSLTWMQSHSNIPLDCLMRKGQYWVRNLTITSKHWPLGGLYRKQERRIIRNYFESEYLISSRKPTFMVAFAIENFYIARIHDLRATVDSNHGTVKVWTSNNSISSDINLIDDMEAPIIFVQIIQPLKNAERIIISQSLRLCDASRLLQFGPLHKGAASWLMSYTNLPPGCTYKKGQYWVRNFTMTSKLWPLGGLYRRKERRIIKLNFLHVVTNTQQKWGVWVTFAIDAIKA